MRNSSAKPVDSAYRDIGGTGGSYGGAAASSVPESVTTPGSPLDQATIRFPNLGRTSGAFAITSRLAGRINASSASELELKGLLSERQTLIDKKFANTITRAESNRLEYVRWSLDRIEDARYGMTIDMLHNKMAEYENFLQQIDDLSVRPEGK